MNPPTDPPREFSSRTRALRIALVAAVLVAAIATWRSGLLASFATPGAMRASLVGLGAWGYLAFIAAYAVLQPFGVPGTVFILVAPLVWTWPVAFALSMAGTMAASVVGFSFARAVGRDWIAARIPERFKRYDEALAQRAFVTVFVLRFVFWMPPLLHAFFGVSKVRFWTHFWGSFVGYLVPLFLVSFFGQQLFDWMKNAPAWAWFALTGVAVIVASAWWFRRRRGAIA